MSPAYFHEELRKIRCAYANLAVIVQNLQNGGGASSSALGTTSVTMTNAELQAYTGPQVYLLTISDAAGDKKLAAYDSHDTTSPASDDIIVDANGRRYHRESVLSYLEKVQTMYSPYP